MCLAVPGLILSISSQAPAPALEAAPATDPEGDPLWRCAVVDFGGVRQQVSLACLAEARVGDLVLVHVGLALSIVNEEA